MRPKPSNSPACMAISRRQALASLCAMPMLIKSAAAQTAWPTQPVRILLGQPAGSGSDPMARGLSPHLAAAFGQPFIVENMPGGGGVTAAAAVARATDDHTIGIVLGGPTTTAKALNPSLAYDPAKDFRPISLLNRSSFVLTVHPGSFAGRQFADVIDYARAHPGQPFLRLDRSRYGHAPRHGGTEIAAGAGYRPCAVSWVSASDAGSGRRPLPVDV